MESQTGYSQSQSHLWMLAPFSEWISTITKIAKAICESLFPKFSVTFWPRFSTSRNDSWNWVEVKDILTLRPAPSTEFRGGSHCDSQIGWGPHICKVLPGCIITHSKTPMNLHIIVLFWALRRDRTGGWGWEGAGLKIQAHMKVMWSAKSHYAHIISYYFDIFPHFGVPGPKMLRNMEII